MAGAAPVPPLPSRDAARDAASRATVGAEDKPNGTMLVYK